MIAGIAAFGEVVVFGKAFEVGAGNVVQQQIEVEPEEGSELCFEIVLDGDANDVRIVGEGEKVIVGKKPRLLSIALAVVEHDGALPAAFLIVIEFAEMSDNVLARSGVGANGLYQGVVGVRLAVLGTAIASKKHANLLGASMAKEAAENQRGRFPLHRQNRVSTTKKPGNWQETGLKIVVIIHQLRNLG